MARARNIKPGFFKNYELADLGPHCQLLFAGLWCLADKEGRLEDKPRLIKVEVFPYYEVDVNRELTKLERCDFVRRYVAHGVPVIEILNFKRHQSPHHTEKASELPGWEERDPVSPCFETKQAINGDATVNPQIEDGGNPPDSLIPDSLIPDSLIPDSLGSAGGAVALPAAPASKPAKVTKASTSPTADTWNAYASAYQGRYGVEPVRNATVNGQLANFVTRLGAQEAPYVAAFYVWHNNRYYAQQMHAVGPMVKDAEKLRTEWATGNRMTATQADQADKTQTNGDVFGKLIREAQDAQRNANT